MPPEIFSAEWEHPEYADIAAPGTWLLRTCRNRISRPRDPHPDSGNKHLGLPSQVAGSVFAGRSRCAVIIPAFGVGDGDRKVL